MRSSLKPWEHVGAATGVVGVVLTAIGGSLGDPYRSGLDPDPTDPSPAIAQALLEVRSGARTGAVLGLVAAFLLIWFVASTGASGPLRRVNWLDVDSGSRRRSGRCRPAAGGS